jgi:hypothetical protein
MSGLSDSTFSQSYGAKDDAVDNLRGGVILATTGRDQKVY